MIFSAEMEVPGSNITFIFLMTRLVLS